MANINPTKDGCWIWSGYIENNGYGRIQIDGKRYRPHRLMYILVHGEIPLGHGVLHRCDTPLCVNPDHLFTGTQQDNVNDMLSKGRRCDSRGEGNGCSKLTDEIVRHIRKLKEEHPHITYTDRDWEINGLD